MTKLIDLMIIGAQKAGATSMLRYLQQHPETHCHEQQEMMFFADRNEFNSGYQAAYKRYFGCVDNEEKIILAKCAVLYESPENLIRLINHNPEIRIIFLLRNPTDRAYSNYWYWRQKGIKLDSFEIEIQKTKSWNSDQLYIWKQTDLPKKEGLNLLIYRGIYYLPLEYLYRLIGKDQIYNVLLDDMVKNPKSVLEEIFKGIRIDPEFSPDIERVHNITRATRSDLITRSLYRLVSKKNRIYRLAKFLIPGRYSSRFRNIVMNSSLKKHNSPAMNSEIRSYLIEYFKPYNTILGEMIQKDLSIWYL